MSTTKICFVVMGFGKKTDHETGRTLDLDATYDAIIKPAVECVGLKCIRADEIKHSGTIDLPMYEYLLTADLVIADISTGNVNAVYELGVRHALRPRSTIVMKEDKGKLDFNLDHTKNFTYQHLGEDIGYREVKRAKDKLFELVKEILQHDKPDSPVYTFIPDLRKPQRSKQESQNISEIEVEGQFSRHVKNAKEFASDSDHRNAADSFKLALEMSPNDTYLTQQLALHTYKSRVPSCRLALEKARDIINTLQPEHSNDPETLGIAGAIHKRMWSLDKKIETLDKAVEYYERGFKLRRDYYNGENAATCLFYRSKLQQHPNEALYDRMSAHKIYTAVLHELNKIIDSETLDERSDRSWIFATLANCNFALGETETGQEFEDKFLESCPAEWHRNTFNDGKEVAVEFSGLASK